jgi:hypothetical protein
MHRIAAVKFGSRVGFLEFEAKVEFFDSLFECSTVKWATKWLDANFFSSFRVD